MAKVSQNLLISLVFSILIIIIDQITKIFALKYFRDSVIYNSAGTFGILPAWVGLLGLLGLSIIVLKEKKDLIIFLPLFAAGISNFIDRLVYKAVVDFIHFWFIPVFNFADMVITAGVIVIVIKYMFFDNK